MEISLKFGRKNLFCKTVSILVILSFVFSNITFAESLNKKISTPKKTQTPADINNIVIEKDHGLIKSKFSGNSNKLIINIQDAHCNYEAQSNIVNILEGLIKNHNLSLISVEGADGLIDTTWFRAFPDEEVRKEVATYFMKKGEITGPEFLSITKNYSVKLFGAEDRESYIQNLNAFTSSYPLKAETEKYYNSIKNALNRLKGFIYSADLKVMDAKSQDYESKKMQFNDYIRFLQGMGEKLKINLRNYDNLFRLISVLTYEKKINFSVTDKERATLIDDLSKMISKDELTEMVSKSIAFKTGAISSVEFYNHLKKLALQNDIDLSKKYPNLYNYIIYNSVYAKIDNEKLFNEIKAVETDIKEKLFTSDDQRTLDKLSRHIDILIGMANIKLLNGDFNYYETHRDQFTHESFTDFIKKEVVKYGLSYEVEPPSESVAKSMPKLEEFYTIAMKRDKALVDNTIKEMDREKQQVAVLVTGGFHSEGMAKLLEKRGVSYVVVCPTITKDVPTPYIQVLTNQRTPIEDILSSPEAAKKGMLAPFLRTQLISNDYKITKQLADAGAEFKRNVIALSVGNWFKKVLPTVRNHELARDLETMKAAYATGMRLGLASYFIDKFYMETGKKPNGSQGADISRKANAIVEKIVGTEKSPNKEFDAIFDRVFTHIVPQIGIDTLASGSSAPVALPNAFSSSQNMARFQAQQVEALFKLLPQLKDVETMHVGMMEGRSVNELFGSSEGFVDYVNKALIGKDSLGKYEKLPSAIAKDLVEFQKTNDSKKATKILENTITFIIQQRWNAPLVKKMVSETLGRAASIKDAKLVKTVTSVQEFMQKNPSLYAQYRQKARDVVLNAKRLKIDPMAGAASRLFQEGGQEADPKLSFAGHNVEEVIKSFGYDLNDLSAKGAKFGLSIITRMMVQEWISLEEEIRLAHPEWQEAKVREERKRIMWETPRIVLINDESGENIMDEWIKNRFYGNNPNLVVFVSQAVYSGVIVGEGGKAISVEGSNLYPLGHGDTAEQSVQLGAKPFVMDLSGNKKLLGEDALTYIDKVTKNRPQGGIEAWEFSRINDMLKLKYETFSPAPSETDGVDMSLLAMSLYMLDNGYDAIFEYLEGDPAIKGASPVDIFGYNMGIESLAWDEETASLMNEPGAPFNRMLYRGKMSALLKMKEKGFPPYIRYRPNVNGKKAAYYNEFVSGDLAFLVKMGLVTFSGRKLMDYKNKATSANGAAILISQGNDSRFNERVDTELKPIWGNVGAIRENRENGGELTAEEHGKRTLDLGFEKMAFLEQEGTVNGIIDGKVRDGQAYSFLPYRDHSAFDKMLMLWGSDNLSSVSRNNYNALQEALKPLFSKDTANLVIVRGLKAELIKQNIAPDMLLHPGVSRKSVYIDEDDFKYLLSLPNGIGLIMEAVNHELAHIKNPRLSEEAIERMAPSRNVRMYIKVKGMDIDNALATAKKEIKNYLDDQKTRGAIADDIYDKAIKNAYANLNGWVTDHNIGRISPNTQVAILAALKDAIEANNWSDIVEAFRQDISFGTAGIRGIAANTKEELEALASYGPGAAVLKGPNTINDIVLLLKTAGVIKYAKENNLHKVAIGYDSRIAGRQFAEMIAESFIANSTKEYPFTVYLFDAASPFPELSFGATVKEVRADLGILISASHNPSNYNGYKITDRTGAQLTGNMRDSIVEAIKGVTTADIRLQDLNKARPGEIVWLGGKEPIKGKDYKGVDLSKYFIDMHKLHVEQVKKFIIDKDVVREHASEVRVGYSAFNGAGNVAVPRLLQELGFKNTQVIDSLQELNGMFPAFGWGEQPDPGDPISADIAVKEFVKQYGQEAFDALDILVGTDPDADRAGLIVKVPESQQKYFGKYKLLSANDAWTLLVWYRLQRQADMNGGVLPDADKKYVTFSHVTTDALEDVAGLFGVRALGEMRDKQKEEAGQYLNGRRTWVGFSLIAEYCNKARGQGLTNVAGAEESNGFSILGGPVSEGEILAADGHVNDKDGAFASMLLAEVAAYAKSKGTTMFELLDQIYLKKEVGYRATSNKPMPRVGSFKGAEGITKKINLLKKAQDWMAQANKRAGTADPFTIGGLSVKGAIEFKTGKYDEQHYKGFPDEGIRFFFEDKGLKEGEPFYKSKNYITIRPSGTSQTIRFYTQLFAAGLNEQNLVSLKHETASRAEELALQAQIELLEATGYTQDIPSVEQQLISAGYRQSAVTVDLSRYIGLPISASSIPQVTAPGVNPSEFWSKVFSAITFTEDVYRRVERVGDEAEQTTGVMAFPNVQSDTDIDSFRIYGKNSYAGIVRTGEQMTPVLMNPSAPTTPEAYFMYRGVFASREDVQRAFYDNKLRYDITVLPPAQWGTEPAKTFGHYHNPVDMPEVYQVLSGEATYYMQKCDANGDVEDAIIVKAKAGDFVIMLPGYGHVSINTSPDKPLVMANWLTWHQTSYYGSFKDNRGAAYYATRDDNGEIVMVPNANYKKMPPLRQMSPADSIPAFGLQRGEPIYNLLKNPNFDEQVKFLNNPKKFANQLTPETTLAPVADKDVVKVLPKEAERAKAVPVDLGGQASKVAATDRGAGRPDAGELSAMDLEAIRIVGEVLDKTPLTGAHADKIADSFKKQAIEFKRTVKEAFKSGLSGQQTIKQVVWVNDVNLQPTGPERAAKAVVNKYFNGSLVEVRGAGKDLYDAALGAIADLTREKRDKGEEFVEGKDFVIVSSLGDATLAEISGLAVSELTAEALENNATVKKLGKVLNIKVDQQHLVPMISLCDLVLRVAYDLGDESILRCLNSIAWNGEPNQHFTPADLRRGVLTILPKMGPVDTSEVVEAYRAMEKVLQAL